MNRKDFWYIVAESRELKKDQVLAREVLGEWLAIYRDENGHAVILQDRCLHRSSRLSRGRVSNGQLQCSYHGWRYDGRGEVSFVPSEGPTVNARKRCALKFDAREQDDYIYVRLSQEAAVLVEPFAMPNYKKPGYTTIRLQNRFQGNVTNCAENFVDIPHTAFVHPRIFRDPGSDPVGAEVVRNHGSVKVTYSKERQNFGIFSWFLNPKGGEVRHTDEFFMPNVTTVNYHFSGGKHFIITSQSIPVTEKETLVYTDLTYNYGIWNFLSRPVVRRQGQMIIDQDVEILASQMQTIEKYGMKFQNSPADIIHTFIESIQKEIEEGRDPRGLPPRESKIEFYI
jgi:phenylpropionate dioxygenase-like ring-hydroxylating dioxygenase large terminal subunit